MPHLERPYIDEVKGHQRRYAKMVRFTHSATKAAGVMLLAAIASVVIANTTFHEQNLRIWHTEIVIGIGGAVHAMSLAHIINDALMAVFFLLVGIEIKHELIAGELRDLRQAALPIAAAFGGVLMPAIIYLLFNAGSGTMSGWSVPTATDIAFALGVLALLGDRIPSGLRVFLSTLAVVDDIITVLVIAIFYGQTPNFMWLAIAAGVFAVLVWLNRTHVYSLVPYTVLGIVLWACVFMSGVHAAIAGVLLAFTIPSGTRVDLDGFLDWSHARMDRAADEFDESKPLVAQNDFLNMVREIYRVSKQAVPPAVRLENRLYPWVYFFILPLFALTNSGVSFIGTTPGMFLSSPVLPGVLLGLLLGKPVGIMLVSLLVVKTGRASLPEGCTWTHMVGAGVLAGIGFTMSIFVANLGFADAASVTVAKAAVLTASTIAGIVGFLILYLKAARE
ncbi:MAG: Na+/H+ antiporter NhaA [Actinomycetota bacterium]|nr:Na+/H+ antiporter NhaA [Actinomycetota bacterium]